MLSQTHLQPTKFLVCYAMANKKVLSIHFAGLCNTNDEAICKSRKVSASLTTKIAVFKIIRLISKYNIIKTMDSLEKELIEEDQF